MEGLLVKMSLVFQFVLGYTVLWNRSFDSTNRGDFATIPHILLDSTRF